VSVDSDLPAGIRGEGKKKVSTSQCRHPLFSPLPQVCEDKQSTRAQQPATTSGELKHVIAETAHVTAETAHVTAETAVTCHSSHSTAVTDTALRLHFERRGPRGVCS